MDRRATTLAVGMAALLLSGGCQDYNFNPVGHCVIQPGTKRFTIAKETTADVLFVVDDSGSMAGEQSALATEFPRFLDQLAKVNIARVSTTPNPLPAFDFHVAVTSTASYYNEPPLNGSICSNTCPGAAGQYVCCLESSTGAQTSPQPPLCATNADCAGPTYTCKSTCTGIADVGSYTPTACCNAANDPQPIPCDRPGEACGIFDRFYYHDGLCTPGYAGTGPYPAGHFLADPTNVAAFPSTPEAQGKVLHFEKALDWASWQWTAPANWGSTDQKLRDLAGAFAKNVTVGTCGSPQEQGLETARRAIMGQLAQGGLSQPGVARGDWLHDNSKLVVVWVSDEDDCSAPYSAGDGVVFPLTSDGCVDDSLLPASQQRQFPISQYADFFTNLGRPFGAAFIVSATNDCRDTTCLPMICTDPSCSGAPGTCGGQGVPTRYLGFASELRARDRERTVVAASICDTFGDSLGRIAQIVTPPDSLVLPTEPATDDLTILRIAGSDGNTIHTCSRPAPPAPAEYSPGVPWDDINARTYIMGLTAYDWWFTAGTDPRDPTDWTWKLPSASSTNVYINHATGRCEAGAGETYSADYIGRLPESGCTAHQDCVDTLGGQPGDWTCFAGVDTAGACVDPATSGPGTCICGSPATNCP